MEENLKIFQIKNDLKNLKDVLQHFKMENILKYFQIKKVLTNLHTYYISLYFPIKEGYLLRRNILLITFPSLVEINRSKEEERKIYQVIYFQHNLASLQL